VPQLVRVDANDYDDYLLNYILTKLLVDKLIFTLINRLPSVVKCVKSSIKRHFSSLSKTSSSYRFFGLFKCQMFASRRTSCLSVSTAIFLHDQMYRLPKCDELERLSVVSTVFLLVLWQKRSQDYTPLKLVPAVYTLFQLFI